MYEKYQVKNKPILKLNIDSLTDELKNKIDQQIIMICEGIDSFRFSETDLQDSIRTVKKDLYDRIITKSEKIQHGMISEFFIHLVLSQENIKQECLFFNMAEKSIKKGFDGLYSRDKVLWIMESKSGKHDTRGISHSKKINEAVLDLENKLRGQSSNDPWKEAYNNVSHADVQTTQNIKQLVIKALKQYSKKNYLLINECNIIPCGTVFSNSNSYQNFANETMSEDSTVFSKNYKDIIVFHSTNNIFQEFIDYLNQGN